MVSTPVGRLNWVVLLYRIPREPSSPRIAVWRRLRALGVGQLGDGAVALPEEVRTREHLEWVADQVLDAGGTALLLRAQALARKDERTIARLMIDARAKEYDDLVVRARAAVTELGSDPGAGPERARALQRLRKDLRVIGRRDYFPPAARDEAEAAISELAAVVADPVAAAPPAVAAPQDEMASRR